MHDSDMQSPNARRHPNAILRVQADRKEHEDSPCCQRIASTSWSAGLAARARAASMEVAAGSGLMPGSHPL